MKKLGIKEGMKVLLINEPMEYHKLVEDITTQLCRKNDTPDFIHLFVKTNKEFKAEMKKLRT